MRVLGYLLLGTLVLILAIAAPPMGLGTVFLILVARWVRDSALERQAALERRGTSPYPED